MQATPPQRECSASPLLEAQWKQHRVCGLPSGVQAPEAPDYRRKVSWRVASLPGPEA